MKWNLIQSGFSTGKFNMDYDIELASACLPGEAYFRLYRWNPFCISLGANQKFEDINIEKASADSIDVVKRPTGGRAILHAEEITYSVIISLEDNLTPREIYNRISLSLIKGLEIYSPALKNAELENAQPHFPSLLQQPSGVLCFSSTAKNEVKFGGKKLIGSAQRKMDRVILQHGSILCGTFHKRLVDYLNVEDNLRPELLLELNEKTTELETILGTETDYDRLEDSLISGFEQTWQINFCNKPDYSEAK